MRLDVVLVSLGYFKTRNKAQDAVKSGIVYYGDKCITKSGFIVADSSLVTIKGEVMPYVSRGGLKLEKAIRFFNLDLTNKVLLDIGSSTGGFTDCALKNTARGVIAIDVGTNVMDEELRKDTRIRLYENTDFRSVDESLLLDASIASIDVSFISVTMIIPKLNKLININEVVCLIKPQFECGKDIAHKYNGVIKDKKVHESVIRNVVNAFLSNNFYLNNITYSPIHGGDGNIEYLGYFKRSSNNFNPNYKDIVDEAFKSL